MRDSNSLVILYEVSSIAKNLQKKYNLDWGFNQETPFDSIFYLRNASVNPVEIPPKTSLVINSGIYIQLTDPRFLIEVSTNSNILRNKNIGILNNSFDYDYRNEIKMIVYNFGDERRIIEIGEVVGNLLIRQTPIITFKETSQVTSGEKYKGTKDNNWVQEEKKKEANKKLRIGYNTDVIVKNSKPQIMKEIKERTE